MAKKGFFSKSGSFGKVFTAPGKANLGDFLKTGAVVGGTAAAVGAVVSAAAASTVATAAAIAPGASSVGAVATATSFDAAAAGAGTFLPVSAVSGGAGLLAASPTVGVAAAGGGFLSSLGSAASTAGSYLAKAGSFVGKTLVGTAGLSAIQKTGLLGAGQSLGLGNFFGRNAASAGQDISSYGLLGAPVAALRRLGIRNPFAAGPAAAAGQTPAAQTAIDTASLAPAGSPMIYLLWAGVAAGMLYFIFGRKKRR